MAGEVKGSRKIGADWKDIDPPKVQDGKQVHSLLMLRFPVHRKFTEEQRTRVTQAVANAALHALYSLEQDIPE